MTSPSLMNFNFPSGKVILVVLTMVFATGLATGQSVDTIPLDIDIEIINATTGEPGTIDKLVLQYSTLRLEPVFDLEPSGSRFMVPQTPVKDRGKYILTAWKDDVPYYWSLRGRNLKEKPLKLHIFDTASGLDDVAIVGLNLLIRKTQSMLELEYLIQVENTVRPQVSLVGEPSVSIALPSGVRNATLSYGNGPSLMEMEITNFSGDAALLTVPITTGRNPMRLKTTVTWSEGMTIPMSSNVPITQWSLIASPTNLDIQAFDLVSADIAGDSGHLHFKGPAIAAGESFSFLMTTLSGSSEEEDLFTQTTDTDQKNDHKSAKKEEDEDSSFPFVAFTPILIIIIVMAARRRRQS